MIKKITITNSIYWNTLTGFCFLALMSLLRIVFVFRFTAPLGNEGSLKAAYLLGFRYDLRYVAITILFILLLSFFKPLNPFNTQRGKKIAFSIWMIFGALLILFYTTDFIHYAYVHQRLNASILSYLDNAAISLQMMWQSYPILLIIAVIALSLWLLYKLTQLTYKIALKREASGSKFNRILINVLFFFILVYSIVGKVVYSGGQYPLRWSDAYSLGSDFNANVALNPMQSFFSTLNFRKAKINKDLIKNNYAVISEYLDIPFQEQNANEYQFSRVVVPKINDTIAPKIKNVVLVICESFSAYKSSVIGNPLNATPYFNQMRKQGVYFNRAFSPAYGTARGVWATITGTPDILEGRTSSRNPLSVDQHTILADFRKYEKFYFLGGSASWANIRGVLNNIEDLHIYEQGQYQSSEIDVWGISDKNLFMEAHQKLSTNTKPFFAIIQTADNHRPYTIPEEDLKTFKKIMVSKDSLLKYGFENNDEYNAFRYTDYCFEQFIEAAKKEKYFDNTLFVFIGDHGIKGDAGNMLPKTFTEQGLTNMHIPFLFYAPKILTPKEYSLPVSQLDVLPSIASLCNISYTNTTMGKDVFNLVNKPNSNNSIFLYDDFNQQVGVLNNQYYFGYKLKNASKGIFESVLDNQKVSNDSIEKSMRILTETIYETSKYMLINNKKLNK